MSALSVWAQLGIELLFWITAVIGAVMLTGFLVYLYRNGWGKPGESLGD